MDEIALERVHRSLERETSVAVTIDFVAHHCPRWVKRYSACLEMLFSGS
jgi:hypothetical protein